MWFTSDFVYFVFSYLHFQLLANTNLKIKAPNPVTPMKHPMTSPIMMPLSSLLLSFVFLLRMIAPVVGAAVATTALIVTSELVQLCAPVALIWEQSPEEPVLEAAVLMLSVSWDKST